MHIYHPLSYQKEQQIDRYQKKKHIQKIQLSDSIDQLLFEYQSDSDRVFLLDENLFDLIRYPIEWILYEPLTIEQLTNLVEEKHEEIKKTYHIQGKLLYYDIDNIMIDGNHSHSILGHKWEMKWDLLFIFIRPSLAIACPTLGTDKSSALVYPSSYFSLQFITKKLDLPWFLLLSFHEQKVKLILVREWFYHNIVTLDRWIDHLKQILISNNVISYLSKTDEEIMNNALVSNILEENILFYMNILIQWIDENREDITHCVVSYPDLQNTFFAQQFITIYQDRIGWYIVPNSIAHELDQFGRKRQPHELDILTYLNFSETKEFI